MCDADCGFVSCRLHLEMMSVLCRIEKILNLLTHSFSVLLNIITCIGAFIYLLVFFTRLNSG